MPRFKEVSIPKVQQVYRLVIVSDDGRETPTGQFRVRKRIKNPATGKWTTHTRTFDDFNEAKRFAKAEYSAPIAQAANRETEFKTVFERFMLRKEREQKLARGTLEGCRTRYAHLKFFEGMDVLEIGPRVVDRWLDMLYDPEYMKLQKKTRESFRQEYSLLHNIFTYFQNYEDDQFRSPLLKRHRERACATSRASKGDNIRFLNDDQEIKFLAQLKQKQTFHDLALFQLHTGARIGEAAGLDFADVDFVRNEVTIRRHLDWPRRKGAQIEMRKGTKGGPSRVVPLTAECRAMLLRRKSSSINPRVFTRPDGDWLRYRAIQEAYDRAFARIGTDIRGTHSLRHTFAVRYLEQTKDIHALQKLLGHVSLEDTLRYAKYTYESVRQSFQLFRGGKATNVEPFVPRAVPQR